MRNREMVAELERIRDGGLLDPADVVSAARTPASILHPYFEWDNSVAGERFRQWQARVLIREVYVFLTPDAGVTTKTEVYVSLRDDRKTGAGYRLVVDVMKNTTLRKRFLAEALKELDAWQKRYEKLKELEPIFEARKKVKVDL